MSLFLFVGWTAPMRLYQPCPSVNSVVGSLAPVIQATGAVTSSVE